MHKIDLIAFISSTEKRMLIAQFDEHHKVIMNELTLLASNKLFKTQDSFTIENDALYKRGHFHAIEDLYKHSRNAKSIQNVADKIHHLIRDVVSQLEDSLRHDEHTGKY